MTIQLTNLIVQSTTAYEAIKGGIISGTFRPAMADPTGWSYGDEDNEAMDETNWEAVLSDVGSVATVGRITVGYGRHDGDMFASWEHSADWDEADYTPDAFILDGLWASALFPDFREYFSGRLLWVRVGSEADETMTECATALADYPMLDEEAYSAREHEAWCQYAQDGLLYDVARDWRSAGVDDDTCDDLTGDAVLAASQHLDYYYGFTGDHGPDMATVIPAVFIRQLVSLVTGCQAPSFDHRYNR